MQTCVGQIPFERETLGQMVAMLARHECWASPEETAEWLKTEEGVRIKGMIDALRKKQKGRKPA